MRKSSLDRDQRRQSEFAAKIALSVEYIRSLPIDVGIYIYDSSLLPQPKPAVREALLCAIANAMSKPSCQAFVEATKSLVTFQDAVGAEPMIMPNADPALLREAFAAGRRPRFPNGQELVRYLEIIGAEDEQLDIWIGRARAANLNLRPAYRKWWDRVTKAGSHSPFYPGYVDDDFTYL